MQTTTITSRPRHRGWLAAIALAGALTAPVAAKAQKIDLTMGIIVSPGDAYSAMTASVGLVSAHDRHGRSG